MKTKLDNIKVDEELDIMVSELKEYLDCMADNICLKNILTEDHKHHHYKKYPFMMTTFILIREMIAEDTSKMTKKLISEYLAHKGKTDEQGTV